MTYRLVSVLGATMAGGELTAAGATPLALDFSRTMPANGLYFLLLGYARQSVQLKLTRE